MITKGGFSNAILCVNPEKDGNVLIAAQDEDFFMTEIDNTIKEANEMSANNSNISVKEIIEFIRQRDKEIAGRNPFIVWYRIYPENGRVEKLSTPPEGGTLFRDGGKNDVWRPMPNGSLKMGWNEQLLGNQLRESTKNDQNDSKKEAKSEANQTTASENQKTPQKVSKVSTDANKNEKIVK
jgi:hypothetical protein